MTAVARDTASNVPPGAAASNDEPESHDQRKGHDGRRGQPGGTVPLIATGHDRFPIDEILYPLIVDNKGRVKVKTNWYSAPLWPGLRVTARVWPSLIEVLYNGTCVARQRNYGRGHQILRSMTSDSGGLW